MTELTSSSGALRRGPPFPRSLASLGGRGAVPARVTWAVAFLWLAAFLAVPVPAVADPAAPTTYDSEVTGIDPPVQGVSARVVGGDAFLRVEAEEGVELEVPGYEGEPYIRIDADGVVEVNRNSPTYWLNEDRFGRTAVPSRASTEAPPAWETVGSGGSYGWHDHRIHWMSPQPPPAVDASRRSVLYEWAVPMVVDGEDVSVTGVLEWVPSLSPVPWLLVVLAVGALLLWAGAPRWGVAAVAVPAAVVGISQALASPLGVWSEVLAWAPPMAALALSLAPAGKGRMFHVAGAALLLVWAGLRVTSLWMPVLPSPLPSTLERAVVAAAAGAAAGALLVLYRRLARPPP